MLTEIYRSEGVDINGKTITRDAVRGIIMEQRNLLMIFSEVNGDYKFPGGGVIRGESLETALIREVREESGADITVIEKAFGKVVEYDHPIEKECDVFKMTSHYYICQIGSEVGVQKLDQYEAALGFRPCWISVEEALKSNRDLLHDHPQNAPRWIRRESFVLDQIQGIMLKKGNL